MKQAGKREDLQSLVCVFFRSRFFVLEKKNFLVQEKEDGKGKNQPELKKKKSLPLSFLFAE